MATQIAEGGREHDRPGTRRRSLLPDPGYLWMIFRRRLPVFLAVVAVVLGLTALVLWRTPPRYTANASILVEPRTRDVMDSGPQLQGQPGETNVVDTQVQIMGSPPVLLGVVRQLHLDRDPAYVRQDKDAPPPPPVAASSALQMTAAEAAALSSLSRDIYVKRTGLTYVVDVFASASTADMAANIANAIARNYIAGEVARREGTTTQNAQSVRGRADELRAQAVADDAAMQQYMIRNNLLSAEGATMAEQQVSTLGQQIAQAESLVAQERGRLNAARAQAARGGGGADTSAALSSETISSLRQQEAAATALLATLQARYGDLHPEVVKARDQVADIRRQLGGELNRIQSSLAANVRVAESGLASLRASQSQARGTLAGNSAAQVGLLELKRKAEASTAVYNAFLARAKEIEAQAALPQADASVQTLARLPDAPAWPNYRLGAILGLGLALIFGLVGVAAAEYLDGTLGTRNDVEDGLDVRYLGAVPDLASTIGRGRGRPEPALYVLEQPFSMFAESMRTLATSLIGRKQDGGRIVAITSALPKEGKSTVAVCMARVLAAGGRRVVLVDGDLRRHSSTDTLGLRGEEEHLLRVVAGEMPLERALVKDGHTDLQVLTTRGPTGSHDHLSSERVLALYAELRRRFDVVIVDTAPVLGVAETRELTRHADVTLLIGRWRKTSAKAVQSAIDILDQSEAHVAGLALTMVDVRRYASTGLGDAYGYHKQFAGYYVN